MNLLCVLLALAPGLAAAGCAGVNGVKDGPRVNLQDKLSSTQGNSAGADWYVEKSEGGGVCVCVYLPTSQQS